MIQYLEETWGVTATGASEAKKRITDILAIAGTDQVATNVIEELFQKSFAYVEAVYSMETALQVRRHRLEGEELREVTERFDHRRRLAHNALIDQIKIVNRYLFRTFGTVEIPAGGIYSRDPRHISDDAYRSALGDWAGEVVLAFFVDRKK